jgi:threonine/homoserine/homoserine lactone efflux protein
VIDPLFAAYLSFALLFAITPGATTALVMRNTLAGGRAAGFGTAAGAALANATYAAATGLGLATVLSRWPGAFSGLRIAGACYLGGLGAVGLWRAARSDAREWRTPAERADETGLLRRSSFRQGLTLNLLNPSIAAFYLSAVPSFLPARPSASRLAAMAAAHVIIAFGCHSTWAMVLHGARRVFHVPGRQRWLEIGTGLALIGLAARILLRAR